MGLTAVIIKFLEGGREFYAIWNHIIGFFAVSLFLLLIFYASKGRAIGGGDIKLMAVAGLLLGWQLVILAFFLGCILAAIIHPLRMKLSHVGRALAFGPYLSVGIALAMFFGRQMITWYIETFFVY
jgi:leader peptidase (prepilin peptidase)/N-methyltransferase